MNLELITSEGIAHFVQAHKEMMKEYNCNLTDQR